MRIVLCSAMPTNRKLPIAIISIALAIACTYATEEQPKKHRTARLVREFPRNIIQRFQTIEYPSYNIPNPYGPGTYAFGYEIEDPVSGNVQFRDEEKLQNGTVRGSYGYLQPDGTVVITRFIADLYGYRANTEIKQADGQHLSTIPTRLPSIESQGNSIESNIAAAAANPYPMLTSPPTYNPALNPNFVDPQYTAAILNHIKNQQFYPSQGLAQYPYGVPSQTLYDAPSNGNIFTNFLGQIPSNFYPSNLYNSLQTTFPAILPQENPFNTLTSSFQNGYQQFAQNNPFGNFINTAQSQFQQYIPQTNPLAGWLNPNQVQKPLYLQQQQQQYAGNRPGANVYGDTGLPPGVYGDMPLSQMGMMGMLGNKIPTTKRRGITTTRRKNGYKTRDGTEDWLDDFLESRKREVIYGTTTTTTPSVVTTTTGRS
ncbi:uncharacterized protein LOC131692673 isoform X2 [Topomyia yanbarensis]|uniref:uncharacterized protein LOC131692673 isoform X2 n=1 Tax=Topomyia yanbarensis TaxID=2498891 RepID=UPI00273C332E|nr:uncharacterized protein LOC131692673 isoform X2 [Topomyia yanbarensis]